MDSNKSLAYKYLIALFICLCLGVMSGLLGYYVGRSDRETVATESFTTARPSTAQPSTADYYVGVGKYDVTGPIAEVNMMGYAVPSQTARGLHLRLYSRAFIFTDLDKEKRVVFVSVDMGMMSQIVKLEVVKKLKEKFGDLYDERNVALSGTHSHSGPAGFFQFLLFEVTSLGFVEQSTDAFVDGIVRSIEIAHNNLQPGRVRLMSGDVNEGNINRSPSAYLANPEEERARYTHDTEQEMPIIAVESESGEDLGIVTWYPVHPTSMNRTNVLISSDNKGRASTLYEATMNVDGKTDFIAAFSQANLGDVSPNTNGPICINTGRECDFEASTCGFPPSVSTCIAFGPGEDMVESTDIIGRRQFDAAKSIVESNSASYLQGDISFSHQFVDMTKEQVTLPNGTTVTTCKPAMGYSFAAGTTDGPGAPPFVQSMTEGTPVFDFIRDLIGVIVCTTAPTQQDYDCHLPKPVLLPTGHMDLPYAWHPSIVDVQLLRVGQLIIAAVPGEFSTMAGRRLKEAIMKKGVEMGMPQDTKVVIAGLSSVYSHYITTPEEYGEQRYEGASTIYGPHTFAAYVNRFTDLVENLVDGGEVESGPAPENILDQQIELLPSPRVDIVPDGSDFGDVITDADEIYQPGQTVVVEFYGANPRHNMKLGSTYLEVQKLDEPNSAWERMFTDADWETRFKWEKIGNDTTYATQSNIITGLMDLIARVSGFRINLERIEQLFDEGEDLKVKYSNEGHSEDRDRIISDFIQKGILIPEEKAIGDGLPTTAESHVTIEWDIPMGQMSGLYRIVYYGDHLSENGVITPFTGFSREFQVRP